MSTDTDHSGNQEAAREDQKLRGRSVSAATSVHRTSSQAPCYDQSIHIHYTISYIFMRVCNRFTNDANLVPMPLELTESSKQDFQAKTLLD